MAGTEIKDAVKDVASAVRETDGGSAVASAVGMMGIKGQVFQTIANTTAMALIAVVMWVQFRENAAQSKYDREMFREELKATRTTQSDEMKSLRSSQEARWEKTDITHGRSMEKMGATIDRAVTSLETAVKEVQKTNSIRPVTGSGGPGG